MAVAKEYRYPLRLPAEDEPALEEAVRASGRSINTVLVLAIWKGLPLARAAL